MSDSIKGKLPAILIGLALFCFAVGLFLIAFGLNDTYQLVGKCEPGSEGCEAITWQATAVNAGSVLLIIGPIMAFIAIIIHEKSKKPEVAAENEPSKKSSKKSKKQ